MMVAAAMMTTMAAEAQTETKTPWRVGVTAGADYNVHSMDLQYMNGFKLEGRWGTTIGVTGQYNFADWLGVRADLSWTQKNYRQYRVDLSEVDYKYRNNYLMLPVMASFSFGGEQLHGFCNLGAYAGYWLDSRRKGTDFQSFTYKTYSFNEKIELNSERDQRWDCGLVGGVGLEYQVCKHWAVQGEVRYYYSTTSTTKQYMRIKDYRYNNTLAIQLGVNYLF